MYSYKYKNTVVAILLACILTMAIGYAALQQRLNITGTSSISSVYDVRFTNIKSTPSNENVTDKIAPSYTNTTATFSTNLTSPGDTMTYDITVSNLGTLDAKLILVTMSDSNNPAIEFTYEGVKAGDVLKPQESAIVKVTVKYSDTVTTQPDSVTSNLTIKLDYSQIGVMTQEEILAEGNYLMREEERMVYIGNWMGSTISRSDIESIKFETTNDVPTEVGNNYWDISQAQNGSVMAWYTDKDGDNEYEVTVGQDGGVIANPDSSYLFAALIRLTELNLENLNTFYTTNMSEMFYGMSSMKNIDVSMLNISNVTDMSYMFSGGYPDGDASSAWLANYDSIDFTGWNTSNVTNMKGMFEYNMGLDNLNISMFDTSNVTDMSYMFSDIGASELDLSNFNTSNVTDMSYMFYSETFLKTIYVSDLWNNSTVESSENMFKYSDNLVGGSGVTYDSTKVDASMANYETGYFTYKDYNG